MIDRSELYEKIIHCHMEQEEMNEIIDAVLEIAAKEADTHRCKSSWCLCNDEITKTIREMITPEAEPVGGFDPEKVDAETVEFLKRCQGKK